METFALALNYAIPIFLLLIVIEVVYSYFVGKSTYVAMDTVSSLSSGITNIVKTVLGLVISIIAYDWLEARIGLFDIKVTWWAFVVAFVAKDFAGYWIHRMEHHINIFWNRHIVHHSSEEFNLACALRQSISEIFSYTTLFLVPLALLGVPAEVYAITAPIHLFAQFWYHTRLIDKIGWLENVIVTPSHHRVHHAINARYLDKNFSQIFIVWDKLFGTFQEELKEEPPVYGVKRAVSTWNPILINFQHLWQIISDAWRAGSYRDKLRIWWMPTGWRPTDVAERYPVSVIEDPYTQIKYGAPASLWLKIWSFLQLIITLALAMYLFNRLPDIPVWQSFLYGGFLFLSVYAYTTLMDYQKHALWLEMLKSTVGLGLIYGLGDWFLLQQTFPTGIWLLIGYFCISPLVVAIFVKMEVATSPLFQSVKYSTEEVAVSLSPQKLHQ